MTKFRNFLMVFLLNASVVLSCYAELGQPRDISFKSELDGSKQYYMEMLPYDFDKDKKHDLIIGLHGHGSDRKQFAFSDRPECASFRTFAKKHNMIAVTPDYRAATSWMGPAAEADMVQIIQGLKTKYKINKVFWVGASTGGASVLTFAVLHPDMVDGITSMNGLANHVEYKRFQDAITRSFGGTKAEVPKEYKKRSAEYYPEKFTMPVAFTIGENDSSVPPASVMRLAKILKKNKQKVLLITRQGGHSTNFEDGMTAMEFMLTGIVSNQLTKNKVKADLSKAVIVKSEAQAGEGGIFFANTKPAAEANGKIDLALKFYMEKPAKIKAFCFYQAKDEKGPHTFRLWNINGELILVANVSSINKSGWINVPLPKPFAISASTEYIVSYTCNKAYPATPNVFNAPVNKNEIIALSGHYSINTSGEKAPNKTYKKMSYFIDIIFSKED